MDHPPSRRFMQIFLRCARMPSKWQMRCGIYRCPEYSELRRSPRYTFRDIFESQVAKGPGGQWLQRKKNSFDLSAIAVIKWPSDPGKEETF